MTDRYIDQDETVIYGQYAVGKIRSKLIGLIPAYDRAFEYVAEELEHATEAMLNAVATARAADADVRKGTMAKGSALAQALDVLRRFSKHLDGHASGTVDRKVFFPDGGTVSGVGRSASRVLLALTHISSELKKKSCSVSDAAGWQKQFSQAMRALAPVVQHADSAKTERSEVTPEVDSARQAWIQVYTASKCLAESALRLTGKLDLMPKVFYDLAVPAGTKITAAPEEEPPTPAPGPVQPQG